jgi:hypothetical protein
MRDFGVVVVPHMDLVEVKIVNTLKK